jgi:cell division protein FtsI (penicillin-binding protein 3)
MREAPPARQILSPVQRIRLMYVLLLLAGGIFIIRAFYLQVIRHEHYKQAALSGQLKEYEIPPERGVIEARSGAATVPIVLNETKYTLFADPAFVEDPSAAASAVAAIVGGNENDYEELMRSRDTRYVVLAKKLDKEQHERIVDLELKGVGTREASYRTYPQGRLASQLLGFVNDEGAGTYGLEQALDEELRGVPGQLRAITDAQGVPLASNKDNVLTEPKHGHRTVLTIDIGMQQRLEDILKTGTERARSEAASAFVMEVDTGSIRAMANYPTYDPAEFSNVEDPAVFNNAAVSAPLEVGSVMKVLTAAAALDMGAVHKNSSYYDPGIFRVDNAPITNIEEVGGAAQRNVRDILRFSLNTGATWLLMQMGGGEINEKARTRWHSYMTEHYQFGKLTGIEQGYEAPGVIPDPREGFGLNIQYANTSFGQGMTATPLQMGAALASVVNGGVYYKPRLVERTIDNDGKQHEKDPQVIRERVVKPEVGDTIREFMQYTVEQGNPAAARDGYSVGGKSGTPQIARPEGGYYEDRFNGSYMGFVGGDRPRYVIVVVVREPKIAGYAGSRAAGPIFADITHMLIDNFDVSSVN